MNPSAMTSLKETSSSVIKILSQIMLDGLSKTTHEGLQLARDVSRQRVAAMGHKDYLRTPCLSVNGRDP
jgi:hypothetical protein